MEFCALGLSSNSILPFKTDNYTLTTLSSYPNLFSFPRSTQTKNELREICPESSRIRKHLLIKSDHSRGYRVEVDGVAPTQFHVCRPRIANEQGRVDLPLIDFSGYNSILPILDSGRQKRFLNEIGESVRDARSKNKVLRNIMRKH
jgi:hypothetical protein